VSIFAVVVVALSAHLIWATVTLSNDVAGKGVTLDSEFISGYFVFCALGVAVGALTIFTLPLM
jgi:hypothetical protein